MRPTSKQILDLVPHWPQILDLVEQAKDFIDTAQELDTKYNDLENSYPEYEYPVTDLEDYAKYLAIIEDIEAERNEIGMLRETIMTELYAICKDLENKTPIPQDVLFEHPSGKYTFKLSYYNDGYANIKLIINDTE